MSKKNIIIIIAVLVVAALLVLGIIFLKPKGEENVTLIKAKEVKIDAEKYYGQIVKNYKVPGADIWRIYYADDTNIYLISDDYISSSYIPEASGRTITTSYNEYSLTFFGVYEDYVGAADIKEPAKKWISAYLENNGDSTNINARVIAYLLDTSIWNNFVDNNYAEYAIGSPTIEMFCASYKDTHKDRYLQFKIDDEKKYGYKIKWSDSEEYRGELMWYKELIEVGFNDIYVKSATDHAMGILLASPIMTPVDLITITSKGVLTGRSFNLKDMSGIRPVVCLKEGVGILVQEDGSYIIK